ncbi:MAG TPA: hypothetical protein VGF38_20255 [Ktedonobacterales bacterium]
MSDPYGYDPNQTTEYDPTAMDDFYLEPTRDYPYPTQPAYPPPAMPNPMRNPLGDQSTILHAPTQVPAPAKAPSRARPVRAPRPRVTPDRRDRMARASFWLGILSAAVSLIPICGIVALLPAVLGIVYGWFGRNSRQRGMALAGMLLSMLAIAAAFAIAI